LVKPGKFLTAADKKNSQFYFIVPPAPLYIFFASFPEAVGISRPIFKLLEVTKVYQKIGKAIKF